MVEEPKLHELDARTLRGLAHPLRMQLLSALRRGGPATASQLAEKLGESSGATSYHLRQLAAYGFVEDAPDHGKGRERWWQAVHQGVRFDE
ncbi:MAG: helix-turn-helix transcriptional regulator, partial [Streptomyces sp.]|nr:helix-turn-helix transcriptional regulator [Streptomyces sp.]